MVDRLRHPCADNVAASNHHRARPQAPPICWCPRPHRAARSDALGHRPPHRHVRRCVPRPWPTSRCAGPSPRRSGCCGSRRTCWSGWGWRRRCGCCVARRCGGGPRSAQRSGSAFPGSCCCWRCWHRADSDTYQGYISGPPHTRGHERSNLRRRPGQALRRHHRPRRRRPRRPPRRGARPAGPQRLGQDHHRPRARHPAAPRRRAAPPCSATTSSPTPPAVRGRIGLTGQYAAVDEALTGTDNLVLDRPPARPAPARREGPRRRADRRSSGSPTPPAGGCAPTPAACAGGSTSPPASSAAPTCCSSTSPPPASTRGTATRCGTTSAASPPTASPCCSPRSTWRRPTSSPTTSSCIDRGRVIAAGTPASAQGRARRPAGCTCGRCCAPTCPRVLALMGELGGGDPWRRRDRRARRARRRPRPAAARRRRLDDADIPVAEIGLRLPSLDDVFLTLTGRARAETRRARARPA